MRDYKASLNFNGSSTKVVSNSNTGLAGSVAFSIGGWVNILGSTSSYCIFEIGPFSASSSAVLGTGLNVGPQWLTERGVSESKYVVGLVVGRWAHILWTTSDCQNFNLYLNGELLGTPALISPIVLVNSPLYIGTVSTGSGWLNGNVNDACLWNRSLSATEVYNIAKAGIVPTSGLIRRYPLDEGYGTVATDISATADNGVITAGVWSPKSTNKLSPILRNINNTSLIFTGLTAGKVTVTAHADFLTTAGTIEFWAKAGQLKNGVSYYELFCMAQGGNTFELFMHSGSVSIGKILTSVSVGGVIIAGTTPTSFDDDRWHHIVMTWGTSGSYIYIDGNLAITCSVADKSLTWGGNPTLYFGDYASSGYELCGNMQGIRFYNIQLTATQVYNLHRFGIRPISGLVSDWRCDDGTGTTVTDYKSGHNGTISDATKVYWCGLVPLRKRAS